MLFSVIVPIYKVEKYIRQCIESILNQTFTDFELILVDDGSPDGCPSICEEYALKDERVKVIHKDNGGLVSARKTGTEVAKGEYIVAIDGDDFVSLDMLQVFHEIICEKDYDLICCDHYNYFDNGKKIEVHAKGYRKSYLSENIREEIFPQLITAENGKRFPPSIWAKAFKRHLYCEIQMQVPDKIKIGEDSCVTYPYIFKAQSLYIIDKCLYYYRQNNGSMTKLRKAFDWGEVLLRAEYYSKFMPDEIFIRQIARISVHSMFNVAVTEFYENTYKVARRNIKQKLKDKEFAKFLKVTDFKNNFKEKLALFCLRHRLIFPIYLYSKLK